MSCLRWVSFRVDNLGGGRSQLKNISIEKGKIEAGYGSASQHVKEKQRVTCLSLAWGGMWSSPGASRALESLRVF